MRFFFSKKMSSALTSRNDLLPRLSTALKKDKKSICSSGLLLQSRRGICFSKEEPPIKVSSMKAMGMDGDGRVPPHPVWKTFPDPSPPVLQMELLVQTYDNTWKIEEGGREYKMRFDMPPGIARKDVKVLVEDGRLVVKADKAEKASDEGEGEGEEGEGGQEEEEEWWSVKNYGRGYNWRIKLPVNVKVDKIKARLKDGLLYVILPKDGVEDDEDEDDEVEDEVLYNTNIIPNQQQQQPKAKAPLDGFRARPPVPVWKTLPDPSPPVQQMELLVQIYDDAWKIEEGEGEYKMRFRMPPSVTRKDVKVFVEDGRLVVKADHKEKGEEGEDGEEEEEWWSVKNYGRGCNRRIKLPVNAKKDKIMAQLKDGLLYVTIPKVSASDKFFLGH